MNRRFEIVEPLGVGGMGVVYRARMSGPGGFEKQVALKLPNGPDGIEILRDEAQTLAALRHRAIVGVDGLVCVDGRWALVMEYVEGVGLDVIAAAQTVPIRTALAIVGEVAGALHVAHHTLGPSGDPVALTHRDIKPANIRLTAAGAVKILDFGLALTTLSGHGLPLADKHAGSRAYIAPERLKGTEGPEGDVYALGAILYELLVGEPFGATGPDRNHHQEKVTAALLHLGRSEAGQAQGLAAFVMEMTSFDPAGRPSAREVERRCQAWADRLVGVGLRDFAEVTVPDLLGTPPSPAPSTVPLLPPGTLLTEDPLPQEPDGTPTFGSTPPPEATDPETPVTAIDRIRAILAPGADPVPPKAPSDSSTIAAHWTDEPSPFRALAVFAVIGLLVSAGLALYIYLTTGGGA